MDIKKIKYNPEEDYNNNIGHSLADIILEQNQNKVAISKEDKLKQIALKYNPATIYKNPNFSKYINKALKELKEAGLTVPLYKSKSTGDRYHMYLILLKENNIPFS